MVHSIETERLILDNWSAKDAARLYEYASNPNVGPSAGWKPHEDIGESKRIIKLVFRKNQTWRITLKGEGKALGTITLGPDPRRKDIKARELGYSLDEAYWGRGIMPEAGHAVLLYGFDVLKLDIVSVTCAPDNFKSQRVIEKLGFKYEGTERKAFRMYDGRLIDQRIYSITKEEFKEKFR